MPTFRPYTPEEIDSAAKAYGLDPDFVDAIYAAESSRGTNPQAMEPRSVKRKKGSTIVRGPFQLEDGTTADLIKKHGLGKPNVDDPDVHLDLALRLMRDLKQRYNGDMTKMARAYLGFGTDELGTSDTAYAKRVMAEIEKIKAKKKADTNTFEGESTRVPDTPLPEPSELPGMSDLNIASGEPDIFGNEPDWAGLNASLPTQFEGPGPRGSFTPDWSGLNANLPNGFGLPATMAQGPGAELTPDFDLQQYLASIVEDELGSRDFHA